MEAVDPATPWVAEDDVLLRTAIETGASLEALAKGAVRFSRRFTLREIQDRWHSLLYDPCESTRASFRMSELDNLNAGHASKLCKIASNKESEEKSTKRKTESIRRRYYAMRKRIRGQPFNDNGLDFTDRGFYDYDLPADHVTRTPNGNYLLGDHIVTNTRLLESGLETLEVLEPVGGKDKLKADTVNMKMLSNSGLIYGDAGDLCPEYGEQEQHCFNSPISDGLVRLHSIGLSSPTNREPLWKMTQDVSAPSLPIRISPQDKTHGTESRLNLPDEDHDCLLNSANEGNLLFMDLDGSALADKSCFDNLNSLLLSSPIYGHGEFGPHDSVSVTKDAGLPLATSVVTSPTTLDVATNPLESENSNRNDICLDAIISSPSSVQKTRSSDNQDLDMPCLVNTEVEEVPNNDDIFPVEMVAAMKSQSQNANENTPVILDMKVNNPSQPVVLGARPTTLLKACLNHDSKYSIKSGFPDATVQGGKLFKNNQIVPDNGKAVKPSRSSVIGDLEGDAGHTEFKKPNTKYGQLALPEQISEPISPDEEEPESEDDVPYFSDVEAMVLEMDLCTYDQDSFTCARVSRYWDEDAKRQIVRLEQCARSYMDRRMQSHSAFAILYGRRLKHYIKKPEVILGRATEDMEVDVDLAREGRANKISRRQASIRLEADGSFTVTNLGKFKISVNGMELESGQYMTLSLSNLIEIRGMSFIFEASHKLVQRFLATVRQISQNQAYE